MFLPTLAFPAQFGNVPREELNRELLNDLKSVPDSAGEHITTEQLRHVIAKYQKSAPKLADWMVANVPESRAVFRLPPSHQRRLRTKST